MTKSLWDILLVVPEDLRGLGRALGSGAGEIGSLSVAEPFAAAADALPGADAASSLGRAPAQAKAAFDAVAGRLAELGRVAGGNADSYENADVWGAGGGES